MNYLKLWIKLSILLMKVEKVLYILIYLNVLLLIFVNFRSVDKYYNNKCIINRMFMDYNPHTIEDRKRIYQQLDTEEPLKKMSRSN